MDEVPSRRAELFREFPSAECLREEISEQGGRVRDRKGEEANGLRDTNRQTGKRNQLTGRAKKEASRDREAIAITPPSPPRRCRPSK